MTQRLGTFSARSWHRWMGSGCMPGDRVLGQNHLPVVALTERSWSSLCPVRRQFTGLYTRVASWGGYGGADHFFISDVRSPL